MHVTIYTKYVFKVQERLIEFNVIRVQTVHYMVSDFTW